jgi:hypothetical protein
MQELGFGNKSDETEAGGFEKSWTASSGKRAYSLIYLSFFVHAKLCGSRRKCKQGSVIRNRLDGRPEICRQSGVRASAAGGCFLIPE